MRSQRCHKDGLHPWRSKGEGPCGKRDVPELAVVCTRLRSAEPLTFDLRPSTFDLRPSLASPLPHAAAPKLRFVFSQLVLPAGIVGPAAIGAGEALIDHAAVQR